MYKIFKAVMDRILAFAGLVVLILPLLIVAIAIRIDSKGKAVFKQERIGKDEKPFMLYKFRTMKSTDVEFDINHPVIEDNNTNLTRVGKGIRKFKIDEFLQLINVLKGDMSLIGPRPLMRDYLNKYEPWERQKFSVKPGMSGLSQIKGNGHLDSIERSYYDVNYTKHVNLFKDTEILFKTIGVILVGEEKYLTHVPVEEIDKMRREFEQKTENKAENDNSNRENTEYENTELQKAECEKTEHVNAELLGAEHKKSECKTSERKKAKQKDGKTANNVGKERKFG